MDTDNKAGDSKKKVLIVEDDKFLRELLVKKLADAGFDVSAAIDANEAYANIEKSVPQIALLDLMLPGEDGFSILQKVRVNHPATALPIIILSNLGQQEDIDKAMSLGASDFMVKANFTLDEILGKINTTIK